MDFVLTCSDLRKIVLGLLGVIVVVELLNVIFNMCIDMVWIYIVVLILMFMFGVWIGKCFLRLD